LHPRRGEEPKIDESKLGGSFLWPKEEPWPICDQDEIALSDDYDWATPLDLSLGHSHTNIWSPSHRKHNDTYVGVLQLTSDDFPEIAFPGQADLLQVLWCPRDHAYVGSPLCKIFWRKRGDILGAVKQPISPKNPDEDLIPNPCCLHPEPVIEYPHITELSDQERKKLEAWENEGEYIYQFLLSVAPGFKVGGYPRWIQDPEVPTCQCGRRTEHLLTIASSEFDPATAPRWCPLEDREVWEASQLTNYHDDKKTHEAAALAQVASGLTIGDCGSVYLFICRECEGWPVKSIFQCS
jgi:hypothetical protein